MEDLIKIHFELLLVTEETVSQSSLLNPAQSSLWAIVQFADEDLAGSCILTGRWWPQLIVSEPALQLWQQQEKHFKVERAAITSSAGIS